MGAPMQRIESGAVADLFGYQPATAEPTYPVAPGSKERGGASEAAAKIIAPQVKGLRRKVLDVIAEGRELTADKIAFQLQRTSFSIRPRVSELLALGLIEKAPDRGRNESGMSA